MASVRGPYLYGDNMATTNNAINRPNVSFLYSAIVNQNVANQANYNIIYANKIYDSTNSFDGTSTFMVKEYYVHNE